MCPLLGVALFACATENNDFPQGQPLQTDGGSAGSGGDGAAGASAGSNNPSGGAGAGHGGAPQAGGSNGGAPSFSGTGSSSGAFTTGGAGGLDTGGAGGVGGKAMGGNAGMAGMGGKAMGGNAGMAGAGGAPPNQCTGIVIPAKTKWTGSAMPMAKADLPAQAFDGDNGTRFTSGTAQAGGEWLEIDFHEVVTLNEIKLFTNNADFFAHYELRLSNASQDFAIKTLATGDGKQGLITVPVVPAAAGRYLTIRQTGKDPDHWWSLHEVSIACN